MASKPWRFVSAVRKPKMLHYVDCGHFKDGDKVIGMRPAKGDEISLPWCNDCTYSGAVSKGMI